MTFKVPVTSKSAVVAEILPVGINPPPICALDIVPSSRAIDDTRKVDAVTLLKWASEPDCISFFQLGIFYIPI